ncbi:hypothetical protein SH2C18_03840 [Clostridium sediminicola]|uniref:hypothetical protein n=1 Tax=Clostridium sediminicola TaxID=3114879 RepID=UPI0031F1D764
MDIFKYIENNKKLVKYIKYLIVVLLVIPVINQLFFSSLPLIQRLACAFLLPVLVFLLGIADIYIILGIHLKTKFFSKKYINNGSKFFIILGIIGMILNTTTMLGYVNSINRAIMISFIYFCFGVAIGANRLKIKTME